MSIVDAATDPLAALPRCEACGHPMIAYGRRRHFMCDETTHVGKQCTCPPGCTDTLVGDGGTCDPECVPCRLFAGTRHDNHPDWKDRKK